jgi:hypothetical protein
MQVKRPWWYRLAALVVCLLIADRFIASGFTDSDEPWLAGFGIGLVAAAFVVAATKDDASRGLAVVQEGLVVVAFATAIVAASKKYDSGFEFGLIVALALFVVALLVAALIDRKGK